MSELLPLLLQRRVELGERLIQHLLLTGAAMAAAVAVGVPLGLWVKASAGARGPILGLAGVVQTVPSVALLGLLLPVMGIGVPPAIVALAVYALLPIVRNTYAGLDGVPAEMVEAGDAMGFTPRGRFLYVELPLALPVIVAGLRTATVICVGVATLAAFIGAGGLGEFIFLGLQRNQNNLILLGALPAAVLALVLDYAIGRVEAHVRRDPVTGRAPSPARAVAWAVSPALVLTACGLFLAAGAPQAPSAGPKTGKVVVGAKSFTEQYLIGEMMALLTEHRTNLAVDRRFGLEGTKILHAALVRGDVDLYAEYTGTGLMNVLKLPAKKDPDEVYRLVSDGYRQRFGAAWLRPFGFNNTYTICVRAADARQHGWHRVSDLAAAGPLRAGFSGEFSERPDGYPCFRKLYGFAFEKVRMLDPGLMYKAAAAGEVDVICGFGTDGRITALGLQGLEDDHGLFPPYYCAPVVRGEALQAHPELREALELLAGRLDDAAMRQLNYEVDGRKRSSGEVARQFLRRAGLLPAAGS
ncbi:MAG: ABC transporter permease subunit [Armatimonadetes bacterium]|nr:ABC transporter permease subunit [Armatimonadota bacterium]